MLSSVRPAAVLLTVLATAYVRHVSSQGVATGGESMANFVSNLGHPMPSSSIVALDIEMAETVLPPLARPPLQLHR